MTPIRFQSIQTKEDYEKWQTFAESFGHSPNGTLPIFTMSRGDKMFGYYHPIQNVIVPSYHSNPDVCTPRDFRESAEAVSNFHCLSSMSQQYPNGVINIAIDAERQSISDKMLSQMGFEDTGLKIYRRVP